MTTDIDFDRPRSARRAAPAPQRARIAGASCVVCGLGRAEVLVCRECAEQPAASLARVKGWIRANNDRANALLAAWDAAREPQQAKWDLIQDSVDAPDFAARCEAHRTAGNVYGHLLDAHAAYEAALQPLNIERQRLEKAERVLENL